MSSLSTSSLSLFPYYPSSLYSEFPLTLLLDTRTYGRKCPTAVSLVVVSREMLHHFLCVVFAPNDLTPFVTPTIITCSLVNTFPNTPTTSHPTAPSDPAPNEEVMDLTGDEDAYTDDYDEEMSTSNQHSSRNMYDSLTQQPSASPQALDPSAAKSKRPRSPLATTDAPTPSNKKKGEKKPTHSTSRADYLKTSPTPAQPSPTSTAVTPRSKPPTPATPQPPIIHPPTDSPVLQDEVLGDGFTDVLSKRTRAKGGGRPPGTGGPNKAVVMAANATVTAQLASSEQENARLRQVIAQLQPSASPPPPPPMPCGAPNPQPVPPQPHHTFPHSSPQPPPQQPAPVPPPQPQATTPPKHHQHLRHSEKARPSRSTLDRMHLSPYSPNDIVVTFDLPAGAQLGNHSLTRTPKYTGKDLKVVFVIASFLSRGLLIPSPTITRATNRHQEVKDLRSELNTKWTAPAKTATPKNPPPSPLTLSLSQAAFLNSLHSWDGDSEAALGDILLNPPLSAPMCRTPSPSGRTPRPYLQHHATTQLHLHQSGPPPLPSQRPHPHRCGSTPLALPGLPRPHTPSPHLPRPATAPLLGTG